MSSSSNEGQDQGKSVKLNCGYGWNAYGQSCYYFVNPRNSWDRSKFLSWDESRAACQELDSEMVCIHHEAMNDFVAREAHGETWIGYSDAAADGVWKWDGGCVSTFEAWSAGEPSGIAGPGDCATVQVSKGVQEFGHWRNRECDSRFTFACVGSLEASHTHALETPKEDNNRNLVIWSIVSVVCFCVFLSCFASVRRYVRKLRGILEPEEVLARDREAVLALSPARPYRLVCFDKKELAATAHKVANAGTKTRNQPELETSNQDGRQAVEDENCCPVCLNTFDGDTAVRMTKCSHVFCADCLEIVVARNAKAADAVCPLCRALLVPCRPKSPSRVAPEDGSSSSAASNASQVFGEAPPGSLSLVNGGRGGTRAPDGASSHNLTTRGRQNSDLPPPEALSGAYRSMYSPGPGRDSSTSTSNGSMPSI
eukprot:CAMPEP_0172608764 /NCGR_PEP_ID=MMETSP1068-20121228/28827_1 /TAXON_ID=35684 /ORGANISM="Pseudopedinella elastica, Strain CCMP716" /LENGTH=425 /DNA_ID=CAMNT_0013412111 /DNA_START=195 /DNA_END=1472 /DNA_ORIENTATION=+